RRFWVCLVATVPILALSPMIQQFLGLEALEFAAGGYVLLALSTFVYLYGGWPFLSGLVRELSERQPGMMTLIAVAITAAFGYSAVVVLGLEGQVFFWELATLIDIMLLGHWIEMRSVMGAARALQELAKLMPDEAHRIREDGSTEDVPVADLVNGERILVKPGEKIPADGVVVAGQSAVNEAVLTGESTPVEKAEGAEVIGGAVNGDGSLEVEVRHTGDETYLSQVIRMVEEAQQSKSRSQDLANRAALWLTVIALSVGAVTLAAWLLLGRQFEFALERTITVMVITCPHALGLAVPLVVAVSTAIGAKRGLLIRDRAAFERSRTLDAIVFDKTGTLTEGRFGVSGVTSLAEMSEDEVLALAAAVERHSGHPIAQGIVRGAEERGLDSPQVSDFQAIPGKGARGTVEGHEVLVVSPGYLREHDIAIDGRAVAEITGKGRTVVYLLEGNRPIGAVALADVIRAESREAISRLHELGIQALMLTGDNRQTAEWVAEELGLDDYFAEVLPGEKADKIRQLQGRGLMVGMVGDGVNDAPALAQADIGIAIGAGTDVAIESADIVLVRNDPRNVTDMLALARATWAKMVQNLAWATGYNVFAIPLAAGVLAGVGVILSPAVGAILMSASTVIVAINARLLRLPE
ncbi:MAG: copper-translocating P-type ATPase, partial [Armatimonadota bacterium]